MRAQAGAAVVAAAGGKRSRVKRGDRGAVGGQEGDMRAAQNGVAPPDPEKRLGADSITGKAGALGVEPRDAERRQGAVIKSARPVKVGNADRDMVDQV